MHDIRRAPRIARQRGIAIVTVLLVVALAATLAASIVWRELVAIRDVGNQRVTAEAMWAERGAVEWARAMLRAQGATSNVVYDGQAWSIPVKDVQLSSVLSRDAISVNGELADAWISGWIEDAQDKFNLTDLVSRSGADAPWQVNGDGLLAYRRLLENLSISPALAQATADYMLRSLANGKGSDNWPLQLVSLEDLIRVPGYDAQTVRTLSPFVTVLPEFTTVNVNTATAPALRAAIPALSDSDAQRLVERRNTAYFVSTSDIAVVLGPMLASGALSADAIVGVTSGYFIAHCTIHSARINRRIDTLIARYGIGNYVWTSVIWVHRANA